MNLMQKPKAFSRGFASVIFLSGLIVLVSCRTTDPKRGASSLLSQETNSALNLACREVLTGDEIIDEIAQRDSLCRCLQDRSGSVITEESATKACKGRGDLVLWEEFIYNKFKRRWPKDFIALDPDKNAACLKNLTYTNIETFFRRLQGICESSDVYHLEDFITFPKPQLKHDNCWELVGMTPDGCFEAESCAKTTADLKYLPLDPPHTGSASGTIKLCHPAIQKIHRIKDPGNANLLYNKPFAIELSAGRSTNRAEYGAPNCHGTAQAVIGGALGKLTMTGVSYRSLADEPVCHGLAESALASRTPPTVNSLPLEPGGLLINMNHDRACSALDCGKTTLYVDGCPQGKLSAYTFVDKMCVNCWSKMIEDAGLKPLSAQSRPKDLQPGCLLTQEDHSVVIVLQSDNFCYFYEATSPFGPPQLRAQPCATVWGAFDKKWCPEKPLKFSSPLIH